MLLVDTSIWIDVETGRADVTALGAETDDVGVCPAIVHEVLRGATTRAQYRLVRDVLLQTLMVDSPTPLGRFEEAADLYLRCRAAGYTMSGFDCLIASAAIAHDAELLHRDEDYDRIQRVDSRLRLRRV